MEGPEEIRTELFRWPSAAEWRHTLSRCALPCLWIFGAVTALGSFALFLSTDFIGYDAHAYWLAGRTPHPYGASPGSQDAFLYSPAFLQLIQPLALLPWPVFAALWMAAESAVFVWLTAPLPWRWRIPVLLICIPEVLVGNVYAYLVLAAVLGVRRPAFWAFPLLTKVTPGCLGLLWFLMRKEWGHLAQALAVTLVITVVSYLMDPVLWHEWLHFLLMAESVTETYVELRTVAAAAIVVVAARLNKAWCLPIGMWLGAPMFAVMSKDFAFFTGIVRLRENRPSKKHRQSN